MCRNHTIPMLVGFGKTMVDHSNPTLDAHASNQRKLVDPKTFCFPIHTYMCYIQYIYYILMFIRCVFVHIMFNVHIQQYNYPFFRRIYIYTHMSSCFFVQKFARRKRSALRWNKSGSLCCYFCWLSAPCSELPWIHPLPCHAV